MKSLFPLFIFSLLFITIDSAAELLDDPGCEGVGGWADREDGSAAIAYQQSEAHSGSYCIGFTGWFSERIESDPRTKIIDDQSPICGSAWVKNTNAAGRVGLYINCYQGTTFTNRSIETNTTSTEWTELKNMVIPHASVDGVSLLIYGISNGKLGKHFDDVFLGFSWWQTPTEIPTVNPNATNTPTPVIGDMNGDGQVNSQDLMTLTEQWKENSLGCDLNNDGTVGYADLFILSHCWHVSRQ